mgnify:CR=1 FL=1
MLFRSKNIVILDTNALPKDGLESLIKQQPNKKLFGILYPYVWFYQKGSKGKENGFKRWLKEIGEVPAILDTSLTNRSSNQIQLYMEKHGFFNAVVKDTVITDRQYANVFYNIYCGTPYRLGKIEYSTKDSILDRYIGTIQSEGSLVTGKLYNEELFEKERERITAYLKSNGFYSFSKNYITFRVDSSLGTHQVNLKIGRAHV